MRVMTYNVHSGIGMDGRYCLGRIAETIAAAEPDVVGLQEIGQHWNEQTAWEDQVGILAEGLGMYGFMAPIYTLDPQGGRSMPRTFGCAILTRLPVLENANHAITRISTFAPELGPHRMPGFGEVSVDVGGSAVHLYCTHLYWKSQALRCQEIEEMAAITAAKPGPFIVVGDYNARPGDDEITLANRFGTDVWAVAGGAAGNTFPANAPDRRIDFIFISPGLRALTAKTIASDASDHLPVVADIELADNCSAESSDLLL